MSAYSSVIGTATLTYDLLIGKSTSAQSYSDNDVSVSISLINSPSSDFGYIFAISPTFSDDINFPSIEQNYEGKPPFPGIAGNLGMNINTGLLTSCSLQFSNANPFTVSNVNLTVVITNTNPTVGSITIAIPAGTYTYTDIPTDGQQYNFSYPKATTGEVYDQLFYASTTTPTATLTATAIFSPAATIKAATIRDQTSALLTILDQKHVFLSRGQQTQIVDEAGKITAHSVSVVECLDRIVKAITKQ